MSNRNLSTILFFPLTRSRSYFCPFSSQLSKRKQQKQQKNLLSSFRFALELCNVMHAIHVQFEWNREQLKRDNTTEVAVDRSQSSTTSDRNERVIYFFFKGRHRVTFLEKMRFCLVLLKLGKLYLR